MTRVLTDDEVTGIEKKACTLLHQGESINSSVKLEGLDKHPKRWLKILQKCLRVREIGIPLYLSLP